MHEVFLNYLFNHFYFVSRKDTPAENQAEVRLSLASLFNIRIKAGTELLQEDMIHLASKIIGITVPKAFYRGFPESVRELSPETLLIDQLLHYYNTYYLGNFDDPGHSLFEEETERKIFRETAPVKDFSVITEEEAVLKVQEYTEDLLSGSRQLSDEQYELVLKFIQEYGFVPEHCGSKNTAIRLLIDTRSSHFSRFLVLSDVPKLAEELCFRSSGKAGFKKLKLKNQDRKLISAVMDQLIADGKIDTRTCYEKKQVWSGLLHHIHYQTKDPKGIEFLNAMRGDENHSALAEFEHALKNKGAEAAAGILVQRKGTGALLRNIDYLLSRCDSDAEAAAVIQKIETDNAIILLQMLAHYQNDSAAVRSFRFVRHGMVVRHNETAAEASRRKTLIAARDRKAALKAIREQLAKTLKNRLGKVYISETMKKMGLPIQEGASQGGFGSLPRGSRIPLMPGKKIRGFTYWERVDDIDLSVIGLDDELHQQEFSWRTMANRQSAAITFSGDQTSGFKGGSEFYDIDPEEFKKLFPKIRYLIFCNNIYTSGCRGFDRCVCRAGYMMRDIDDSGEIFEPKTVLSSYTIDCKSTFAYLFGLDMRTNEFVWLNMANQSSSRVAGTESLAPLVREFNTTEILNVYDFFAMMASEIVDDPKDADYAVTDEEIEAGENTVVLRSMDTEKMIALLNKEQAD